MARQMTAAWLSPTTSTFGFVVSGVRHSEVL